MRSDFYRPQTEFGGKVKFSQAFVILSTGWGGGGEVWLPNIHHRSYDQGIPPTGESVSSIQGGLFLGVGLELETRTRKGGGTHPTGMLSCNL